MRKPTTQERLQHFINDGVKVLTEIPQGWVVMDNTLTQPRGYVWVWNLKSPFKRDSGFEQALLKVYTHEQWEQDGELKLNVGTVVDWNVYNQLLGCVPPAWNGTARFQVGEPYTHSVDGEPMYETFVKVSDKDYWKYIGVRERGDFTDDGVRVKNDIFSVINK